MRRRDFVTGMGAAAIAAQLPSTSTAQTPARKGRLKQSAMRVNFDPKMPFEDQCRIAADVGIKGFDLIGNNDWPLLKKYGLVPTISNTGGVDFEDGIIRPEKHAALLKSVAEQLDACAAGGCPNLITVGGKRKGMSNEQGWENAAKFLNAIKSRAEDKGVTICMEVMNSRYTDAAIGRIDQICDHLAFGVELAKRVNSPRFKLLCDIYHLQIMDGNVVANIRENIQYISHFHTGGVPGRHEIDESQELNYRYIAQAIVDLGFTGFVGHEYRLTPGKDSAKELAKAVTIMDV